MAKIHVIFRIMLTVDLILLIILFIVLAKYGKQIWQKITEKWRFIKLVNQLPGPTFLEAIRELVTLKMNRKRMHSHIYAVKRLDKFEKPEILQRVNYILTVLLDYRIDDIFHKYAYKNEYGMTCIWLGIRPVLVLTRASSAKRIPLQVVLENTKLTRKSDDYDIFKPLVGDGLLSA
uniref:Uncharacterized protein n=1 Tax=Setaria digitata TaxID=48799 RepID=A0A915PEA2_9BILA